MNIIERKRELQIKRYLFLVLIDKLKIFCFLTGNMYPLSISYLLDHGGNCIGPGDKYHDIVISEESKLFSFVSFIFFVSNMSK